MSQLTSCEDRYNKILEDVLGTELVKEAKQKGLTDNQLLHYYHEHGRNPEKFKETVEKEIQGSEKIETINENIAKMKEQIEQMKDVRKGLIQDKLKPEKK